MVRKKTKKRKTKSTYEAKDIFVLRGLEPVRKRPALFIGSTGPEGLHHLVFETTDNSLDEALAGFCDEIKVTLLPKNRVEVEDNGRGIPVEKHPQTKKSALETVMTYLHAGAKFGGKAYTVAGGLHGIGVSVVCALSKFMRVEVCRDGNRYAQEYARGKAKTKVEKIGKCQKTGTKVIFEPDLQVFKKIEFDFQRVLDHLRQQAYLTGGLKIQVMDKRPARHRPTPQALAGGEKEEKSYTFYFEGGLKSYVKHLVKGMPLRHPTIFYTSGKEEGVLVEAALQYTKEYETYEESFANNIFTKEGGAHLTGFRAALTRTINNYAKKEGLLKGDDDNLSGRDIREGLTAVVSVKIREPQFEGQTKSKLGNAEARIAVDKVISEALLDFLERNPRDTEAIVKNCILAANARKAANKARQTVLRKGVLKGLTLPGKLADCTSRDPEKSELYIVEGESAGGSSRQARDRKFQAILPLRGKILNAEKARLERLLNSKEIRYLVVALGTAIADDFDLEKLRYHKIILMQDADVDGMHIRTLLLTLFFRYFRPIIEKGYLYIAQPPLYKIQSGKKLEYTFTEEGKERILSKLKEKSVRIQRYKGLGEMNPGELWETTMDPEKRVLLQVTIDDAKKADRIFDTLMGKEVFPRKKFIQVHAKTVKNLDI